ncbi:MAG TPA: SDR family oxidoreductase [Pseudonocardiaceae bacterium]
MTARKPTVLLTGATGVIGRALIDDLAADHDIICLRHRKSVGDARVSEFQGDLGGPTLGLSQAGYQELAGRVDAVVHSAAATAYKLGPERIRATNVGGTERMLTFARRAGAPLYYFSTAFVADPPRDDGSGRFAGVAAYVQSKIDTEQLVRDSGQPAVIVRPSLVIGDSRDGHIARFQGFHLGVTAMVRGTVPVMPAEAGALIDAIPQDVLARATGRLIRTGVTTGEFWLTAGTGSVTLGQIVNVCMEFAVRMGLTPRRPRLIAGDAVDRLLIPLLDDLVLPDLVTQLRQFTEMMWLFQTPQVLESSLPALGESVSAESLLDILWRNLEYWADQQELLLPASV